MVTTIIWSLYAVGYLYVWRYFVGWFMEDFDIDETDGLVDVLMTVFLGTFCALLYPVVIPARMASRLYYRYMSDKEFTIRKFFPTPRPVDPNEEGWR